MAPRPGQVEQGWPMDPPHQYTLVKDQVYKLALPHLPSVKFQLKH